MASATSSRTRFRYNANDTIVVTDGYIDVRTAQNIMQDTLRDWGINGVSDDELDPILAKVAHVFRQGTSAERAWSEVWFMHEGVRCEMRTLQFHASKAVKSENALRVFARSYNNGELAVRIYDMLSDPANDQLRQEACLDYQVPLENVNVSFDFADALVKFPGVSLTMLERKMISVNTTNKVRSSRSAYLGSRDGGSVQDSAAHVATVSNTNAPAMAGLPDTGARNRGGFAAIR